MKPKRLKSKANPSKEFFVKGALYSRRLVPSTLFQFVEYGEFGNVRMRALNKEAVIGYLIGPKNGTVEFYGSKVDFIKL
jgi:hypothetical protein